MTVKEIKVLLSNFSDDDKILGELDSLDGGFGILKVSRKLFQKNDNGQWLSKDINDLWKDTVEPVITKQAQFVCLELGGYE